MKLTIRKRIVFNGQKIEESVTLNLPTDRNSVVLPALAATILVTRIALNQQLKTSEETF